jgi:hypothetical protein
MKNKTGILLFLILLFSGCEKVIEVDLNDANPTIVIEANITNSEKLVEVKISKTGSYFGTDSVQMVSNALVIIENDTGNKVTLNEVKEGIYKSWDLHPMPGQKYKITVVAEGQTYEAESILNFAVEIDSLSVEYNDGFAFLKSGYNVNLYFHDPEEAKNYYRLKIYVNGKIEQDDGDYIIFDDENINGQYIELKIRRKIFDLGDNVTYELISLDKGAYEYFNSLQELISVNPGSAAPSNPISNFSNGALGYFSAWSSDAQTIVVEK